MPLTINLRHLESHNVRLQGQLMVDELDLDMRDEMIQVKQPLDYDIEAQKMEDGILLQGRLHLVLDCQCVRCLRPFKRAIKLGNWSCLLALEGEERVAVVNDCVDLTPYVREDILLEFPQHPLCDPECGGLPNPLPGKAEAAKGSAQNGTGSSAWAELNKLKF